MLFGPPAGLLPPEAENFELFASFWDDFAVKNEHFLKLLQGKSRKIFLRSDDLVVAKQGGEFLIRGGILNINCIDRVLMTVRHA